MSNLNPPRNKRILVIDDSEQIHSDYRKILSGASETARVLSRSRAALFSQGRGDSEINSFEVDSAYQGSEGFDMVRQSERAGRPYAMAFVDVRMPPGWDGITTVKRIWSEYPQLEIVLCTAYSDYSYDEMIDQLGRTDRFVLLKKPFDNMEVRQLALALTEKWSIARCTERRLTDLERMITERTTALAEANPKLRAEVDDRTWTRPVGSNNRIEE